MYAKELNEGLQFTVDGNNNVTAVVVEPELWQTILRALEESGDREFAAMLSERVPVPANIAPLLLSDHNEDWA